MAAEPGPAGTDLAALPLADRLARLREQMDAIPARAGSPKRTPVPGHDVLAVPGPLGELLPDHGLARGTMVTCPRGAVLCGLLAAATASGRHAAVLTDPTGPQIGLLAAWEMGAALERLAVIATPDDRAAEVIGVLADGLDMIVIDLPRAHIRRADFEKLRGRLRARGAILVATRADWARQAHLDLRIQRRPTYGLGRGRGRVTQIDLDVEVVVAGRRVRQGRVVLRGCGGRTQWHRPEAVPIRLAHTG
ncbi:hypothetical protein GCM10011591_46550 [Nocardia camponoti]|uniref:Uncharacterized protein n=2 Tax=Nocardia camponoti TaxID=1616106 RepID=A0A917VFD3_9NOCA|nr:hypothetical protein GCM10011591_46550 [Nocardia camponoti]